MPAIPSSVLLLILSLSVAPAPTRTATPDEGMWTFDNPPKEKLAETYGFQVDDAWLDHVRLSSVRVSDGGSASFVSKNGLVLTNHHVASTAIQKLSSEGHDLVASGFYAPTVADELPCTDLELNVLDSIEDVTARVLGAVKEGATEAEARLQRSAEIARISKEENERTGLRCDVVPLYRGGVYTLYRYKKYTDVRLVFAPAAQTAFFGGDPDNFNFPRYDLDMALLRAYENGEPLRTPHHLQLSQGGVKEGDLVFVSGNPGSTGRLNTMSQLAYLRDHRYPLLLDYLHHRRDLLTQFSARGAEEARRAKDGLFSIDNSIKALTGYLESLKDPAAMERKGAEERELRARVAADAELSATVGDPWQAIADAQAVGAEIGERAFFSSIHGSQLFAKARTIVRLTAEVEKPNDERLPEYRDTSLDSLELGLFSAAPIYADLEEFSIAGSLQLMIEKLGADDPLVHTALGGSPAREAAARLVGGTHLADPGFRHQLVDGGRTAVEASDDTMIRLALALDPTSRELRKRSEDEVSSVESSAGEKIARARFAIHGTSVYPDATFTLRLSYGVVKGFETGGYNVPYKTTISGLYERATAFDFQPPYELDPLWAQRRSHVNPDTPLNFVCTADIIGGNSGSPVVDREGRLVGLIFDGNIQSLVNRFVYDETVARAVAVDTRGILEALQNVYQADRVVAELLQQ